jgi:hypothetical protein
MKRSAQRNDVRLGHTTAFLIFFFCFFCCQPYIDGFWNNKRLSLFFGPALENQFEAQLSALSFNGLFFSFFFLAAPLLIRFDTSGK